MGWKLAASWLGSVFSPSIPLLSIPQKPAIQTSPTAVPGFNLCISCAVFHHSRLVNLGTAEGTGPGLSSNMQSLPDEYNPHGHIGHVQEPLLFLPHEGRRVCNASPVRKPSYRQAEAEAVPAVASSNGFHSTTEPILCVGCGPLLSKQAHW